MNWFNTYYSILGRIDWERRVAMLMSIAWRELANSSRPDLIQHIATGGSQLLQTLDNFSIPMPLDAQALVNQ